MINRSLKWVYFGKVAVIFMVGWFIAHDKLGAAEQPIPKLPYVIFEGVYAGNDITSNVDHLLIMNVVGPGIVQADITTQEWEVISKVFSRLEPRKQHNVICYELKQTASVGAGNVICQGDPGSNNTGIVTQGQIGNNVIERR